MIEDVFLAWLEHRDDTGHQQVELFYPDGEGEKVPPPVGWRCLVCDQGVGQVPK